MKDFINKINQLLEDKQPVVLATIISQAGSTPRVAGTRMLILPDGNILGTIGGGMVEAEVIKTARQSKTPGMAQIKSYDLTGNSILNGLDIICGGRLSILIEAIDATEENLNLFREIEGCRRRARECFALSVFRQEKNNLRVIGRHLILKDGSVQDPFPYSQDFLTAVIAQIRRRENSVLLSVDEKLALLHPILSGETVYIFGAGHVSRQIAMLTRRIGFRTVVLDDRREFANRRRFSDADEVIVLNNFAQAFKGLTIDSRSYIVIVTRGHSHDKTVLAQALKTEADYIGMIGSQRKRNMIYQQLLKENFSQKDIDGVHSPIGLPIGAETPEEIAISIAAELIQVRAASGKRQEKQT